MMKKKLPHIVTVAVLFGFVALALGSGATGPRVQETVPFEEYVEIPCKDVYKTDAVYVVSSVYLNSQQMGDPPDYLYPIPYKNESDEKNLAERIENGKIYRVYYKIVDYNSGDKVAHIQKIEGLRSSEEVKISRENARLAEQKAYEERVKQQELAEAARKVEREAQQNPKNLNRSLYKEIKVEAFSFDMVAGKLPVGSKVVFTSNFSYKPTGTTYSFKDVNSLITVKTDHNFVKDIPESCFTGWVMGNYVPMLTTVKVYVTVKKAGQTGECSVDIVEW